MNDIRKSISSLNRMINARFVRKHTELLEVVRIV